MSDYLLAIAIGELSRNFANFFFYVYYSARHYIYKWVRVIPFIQVILLKINRGEIMWN